MSDSHDEPIGKRRSSQVDDAPENKHDEEIVEQQFEGLDDDLVNLETGTNDGSDSRGVRQVHTERGETGSPGEIRTDTADLAVGEYDRSGGRR